MLLKNFIFPGFLNILYYILIIIQFSKKYITLLNGIECQKIFILAKTFIKKSIR